jgi:hypothetical protein
VKQKRRTRGLGGSGYISEQRISEVEFRVRENLLHADGGGLVVVVVAASRFNNCSARRVYCTD